MAPTRIQRKRVKGFNLQEESMKLNGLPAVSCTRPGKWGNPFTLKQAYVDAAMELKEIREEIPNSKIDETWIGYANAIAIRKYKSYLQDNPNIVAMAKKELEGKNLACFCKPGEPCHADILLEIANK